MYLEDFVSLVVLLLGEGGQRLGFEEGGGVGAVVQHRSTRTCRLPHRCSYTRRPALTSRPLTTRFRIGWPLLHQQLLLPVDFLPFRCYLLLPPETEDLQVFIPYL